MLRASAIPAVEFSPDFHFGIEMECHTSFGVTNPDHISMSEWLSDTVAPAHGGDLGEHLAESWIMHTDGSVHNRRSQYGFEYVSPVYRGERGRAKLLEAFTFLRQNSVVNRTCGLHVHASFPNYTWLHTPNLVRIMTHVEPLFFAMTDKTRASNQYCQPLNRRHGDVITKAGTNSGNINYNLPNRYHGLNLMSFYDGKGIEFRYFHVPQSPGRLDAWLRMIYIVMEASRHRSVSPAAIKATRARITTNPYVPPYPRRLVTPERTQRLFTLLKRAA